MKKIVTVIAVIMLLIVVATVVSIGLDTLNQQTATFKLEGSDYTVKIFAENSDQAVAELSSSKDITLHQGAYYYVADGGNILGTRNDFTIGEENSTIFIDPSYSSAYLNELAVEELSSVSAILRSTYNPIIDNYEIGPFYLYRRGDWGAGYLIQRVDPRQAPDIYRYVVKKTKDNWAIIASPELTISSSAYPDIPKEVLRSINGAVQE